MLLVTLVLCTVIKDNATLFGRHGTARREWISLAQGIENVVFIFFIGTAMVDMAFGRCQIQKRSLAFFQDVILEKGHLEASIRNGSTNNFKLSFSNTLPRTYDSKFFVVYSVLRQRNRIWTKKNIVFEFKLMITATNPEMLRFLLCFQERTSVEQTINTKLVQETIMLYRDLWSLKLIIWSVSLNHGKLKEHETYDRPQIESHSKVSAYLFPVQTSRNHISFMPMNKTNNRS